MRFRDVDLELHLQSFRSFQHVSKLLKVVRASPTGIGVVRKINERGAFVLVNTIESMMGAIDDASWEDTVSTPFGVSWSTVEKSAELYR